MINPTSVPHKVPFWWINRSAMNVLRLITLRGGWYISLTERFNINSFYVHHPAKIANFLSSLWSGHECGRIQKTSRNSGIIGGMKRKEVWECAFLPGHVIKVYSILNNLSEVNQMKTRENITMVRYWWVVVTRPAFPRAVIKTLPSRQPFHRDWWLFLSVE